MSIYFANLKNELQKLSSRKKYFVLALLSIGICLINAAIKFLVVRISKGSIDIGVQNMAMELQGFFLKVWIPFIIFLGAGDLFGAEFQDNSIKALLGRPISRFKIYISKISGIYIMAVLSLFVVFITSGVLGLATGDGISRFGTAFAAYVLDCIPMFILVLMAVFINQFGKSSTFSMFLCIIVYIASQVGGIFIPSLSGLLFTGYLQWHNLLMGTVPFLVIIQRLALLAGYGMVFFSGGYYLFLSREI